MDINELVKISDVNWDAYSRVYDVLLEHNPKYQDIVRYFSEEVSGWDLPENAVIADIGAGTGNFTRVAARSCPGASIIHLEPDSGMNLVAQQKIADERLENISIRNCTLDCAEFQENSIDGMVCVHALYTFSDPLEAIRKMYGWLKPGGYIFLCDIGRPLNIGRWSFYLMRSLVKQVGLIRAIAIYRNSGEIIRQNRNIKDCQVNGEYWLHSPEEFLKEVSSAGFSVERFFVCYRGDSDCLVGRKPEQRPQEARRMA